MLGSLATFISCIEHVNDALALDLELQPERGLVLVHGITELLQQLWKLFVDHHAHLRV